MNGEEIREPSDYEKKRAAMRAYRRRRNRQDRLFKMMLVLFGIVILAVTAGTIGRFARGRRVKPTLIQAEEPKKTVQDPPEYEVKLLTVNEYSRPGTALEEVKGVVVHYTANPGTTAMQNRDYFEGLGLSGETYASSHFIIGIEGELVQCIPCNEMAYASNERNEDTIAIECCIPDESGKFTEETYATLVHLTAWLMGRYDLSTKDVIRHYDVTGKECPKYYVEYPTEWEKLKADILSYIDTYGTEEAADENMN